MNGDSTTLYSNAFSFAEFSFSVSNELRYQINFFLKYILTNF